MTVSSLHYPPLAHDRAQRHEVTIRSSGDLSDVELVRGYLSWLWGWRPCAICATRGGCAHREPEVDIARAAEWARILREA